MSMYGWSLASVRHFKGKIYLTNIVSFEPENRCFQQPLTLTMYHVPLEHGYVVFHSLAIIVPRIHTPMYIYIYELVPPFTHIA